METWGNTETLGGDNGDWEDKDDDDDDKVYNQEAYNVENQNDTCGHVSNRYYWGDNGEVDDNEAHGKEAYDAHDQDDPRLPHPSKHVWLSEEEKVRIAFNRVRTSAAKVDLDRSPFFPRTPAEYVGLKADMVEARAVRLKTKVAEKEMLLQGLRNPRWKAVLVVGPVGQIEEKLLPVYYDSQEDRSPDLSAQPPSKSAQKNDANRASKSATPHHRESNEEYVSRSRLMTSANNLSTSGNTNADNASHETGCSTEHIAKYVGRQTILRYEIFATLLLTQWHSSGIHTFDSWTQTPYVSRPGSS